ncbi:MAG TPA: fatty acid desaturase [Stellaceae bacterium]
MLPYVAPSRGLAWALFLVTLAVYVGAVSLTGVGAAPLGLRGLAAIVAGAAIPSLFVIGHDSAHGAYMAGARANAMIARVAFLPSLHNYSLWVAVHNRQHHRHPNVKGANSWSPLSPAEFHALSPGRRLVERLYRSPLGFAPYYLVERWWRDKFFPRADVPGVARGAAGRDFALPCLYLAALTALLFWAGGITAIMLGVVVPFLIWNMMMGATTYLQHTSRRAPWFASEAAWRGAARDEDVTVHLRVPRWYGLVSHHIMEHPAHHIQPRIPLYRLAAAQARLNELLGERALVEDFSPRYLLATMRACKLYDYDLGAWCDFAGNPTAAALAAQIA